MKKNQDIIVFLIILLAIVLAVVFLILRANTTYHSFRGHQNYFKNNSSIQIEDWMAPHTVFRNFNITQDQFFNEFGIKNTTENLRTPITNLCKAYNLDCPTLISRLNSMAVIHGS